MQVRKLVGTLLIVVQLMPAIVNAGVSSAPTVMINGASTCAPLSATPSPSRVAFRSFDQGGGGGSGTGDAAAVLDRLHRALATSIAGLRLDPTEQADELDLDGGAEAIVEWVTGSIRFEAYAGLLRGSRGTLISGAGNALDQSVLLAQMLRDAGYDARIARGRLDDGDTRRLMTSMFGVVARQLPAPPFDLSAFAAASGVGEQALHDYQAEIRDFDLTRTGAYRDALAARDLILDQLGRAGIDLGSDVTDTLLSVVGDYFWVQYRTRAAGPWLDAHPAFGALPPPATVQVTSTIAETIPEDLQHRLRIEFTLERRLGERLQTEALMDPWERPVANLIGVRMSIGNTALGLPPETTLEQLGERVAEVGLFAPTFMGRLAPGAQAFDLFGNVVPPDAASSDAAAVIQTVTQRGSQAAAALGGLGPERDDSGPRIALTAQWIDYILIAPDGRETRHRRFVFDRLTPEARAHGGIALQDESVVLKGLLTNQSFMVNPGTVTDAYLAKEMYEAIGHASRTMRNLQRRAEAGRPGPAPTTGDEALKEQLLLFAAFDAVEPPAGTVTYRSEPSLLVLFNEMTPGPNPIVASGVDIIHNARQVLRQQGDRVVTDPATAILGGTWETSVEHEFVASRTDGDTYGTYQAMAAAEGKARVLAPGLDEPAGALTSLGAALPLIQQDLARGYAMILPVATDAVPLPQAWWRVDPATGETLGIGYGGRGITSTERIVKEVGIAGLVISGAFVFAGSFICMDHPNPACCVIQNVAYTAGGIVIGLTVGAITFSVGAAIVTLLAIDIGGGILGTVGALPDLCS